MKLECLEILQDWIQTSRIIPLYNFLFPYKNAIHSRITTTITTWHMQLHILQLVCLDVWWDSTTWQKFYFFSSFQNKIGINQLLICQKWLTCWFNIFKIKLYPGNRWWHYSNLSRKSCSDNCDLTPNSHILLMRKCLAACRKN